MTNLGRDAAWMLLGTLGAAPAVLLASVLLARWLPPAENGQVQALVALLTVLSMAAQLGTATSGIVRWRSAGVPPARVATTTLAVAAAGGLVVAAGVLALRGPVGERLLAGARFPVVAALALAIPPAALAQALGGLARGAGRFRVSGAALWIQQAGRLVTAGIGAAFLAPTAANGAWAVVVPYGVAALLLAAVVLPETGLEPRLDPAEARATVGFGARTLALLLTSQLHERLDVLLLASLWPEPGEVAIYAVAVGVAARLHAIPLALSAALLPRLGAEGDAELVAASFRRAFWATAAPAVALAVACPLVPVLFGPAYAASVAPLLLLLPASVAWPLGALPTRWFQARDRQIPVLVIQLAGLALNVALGLWWIPRAGAVGAAAASLVSYLAHAAALLGAFVAASGIGPSRLVPTPSDAWRRR